MRFFQLLLVCLSALYSLGQQTVFIKDQFTGESIPFVKVRPSAGSPFLTDIDGAFQLNPEIEWLDLRMHGFRDTIVYTSGIVNFEIYLTPLVQEIENVVVLPGENPAHRIIDLAVERRKQNDPMSGDAFRYETYSKFIFDINREALEAIPNETSDSNLISLKNFFDAQYLFMLESASTRTFIPPAKDHEEITAYKVSGFNNPMFSTFASEMQSFSFYEDQFQVLGKSYINPISKGATKRYLFILEDTTIVETDTTFTIFYRPRKGKNFDGLTGRLYISTKGFAIEKVTASPYKKLSQAEVTIIQEYIFVDGKKWFPAKLSTELNLTGMALSKDVPNSHLQGKGSTYIKNIELNPDGLRKRDFDNVSVSTSADAGEITDESWDSLRTYKTNAREKRTYEMIDSLSQANDLEKKLTLLTTLMEGKLPLGPVNIDLTRLINYNLYEKYRFGLGLESSESLMKNIVIGAYYGWATQDKESKFGGYSTIHFYRKRGLKLDLKYQQDLLERGGTIYQKDAFSLSSPSLIRHFFIEQMDRQRLGEVALSTNMRSNIKLSLIGSYRRIWLTQDYRFSEDSDFQSANLIEEFDVAETSVELIWNIREKVMQIGTKRISKGTTYPKIRLQLAKGWKSWFESDYDYLRLHADFQQDIPVRGIGKISWNLAASQTIGDVPLALMHRGNGTGRDWNLSVMNTFETMEPSEFFHTRQIALYTRLLLIPIKTKMKWNEPQIGFHHAIGYGEMPLRGQHSLTFKSMDQGFFEGGLILNNLYISNYSGLGVGLFYRYGVYSSTDWKDNIMPKISLSITL